MLETCVTAPGFADPVFEAQATFRAIMNAMARPGRIVAIEAAVKPPAPLGRAAAAVILTLADFETPVWLDRALAAAPAVAPWIRFHTGATIVADPAEAAFALAADARHLPDLALFARGSQEYPDRSATIVVTVEAFSETGGALLAGPGIEETARLAPEPLPEIFWRHAVDNAALFPRGVDFIFASAGEVAALPRSTRIEREG